MSDDESILERRIGGITGCIRSRGREFGRVGVTETGKRVAYCTYFFMMPMDDLVDCPYKTDAVGIVRGEGFFTRTVQFYGCERKRFGTWTRGSD